MGSDDHILAIDVVILVATTIFTFVSLGYIVAMWSMRRNFFIVMRSPLLACALGLSITLRYVFLTYKYAIDWSGPDSTTGDGIITLVVFPALPVADIALAMTAIRLLVMFFPQMKAEWGRFTKERDLVCGLACAYILMELAIWSAAGAQGMPRTAHVMSKLEPFSGSITIAAAIILGGRLRRVDDLLHMSRDIRLVGTLLIGMLCLDAGLRYVQMRPLVYKYYNIAFMAISHPPISWIINIRPVREVLRHIPGKKRTKAETYLLSPPRRRSCNIRVGVTLDIDQDPPRPGGREACVDANRLTNIMSLQPLREAFGEFCRRSLCSESFQFLLDVSEFKDMLADVGEESEKSFGGFGGYLAIVNDYIKDGSHSEVNIESKAKRGIMQHTKFKAYKALSLDERKHVFSQAEREIKTMLADNLLNKFLVSDSYKKVVDFEGLSQN